MKTLIIYGKSGVTFGRELYLSDLYKKAGDTKGDGKSLSEKQRKKIQSKATELGFKIVEDYLNAYPQLSNWLDETKEFAMKNGYVETMFGRRRRLPDLYSSVQTLKDNALRQAINAPIQGTGSDMTLRSIIEIQEFIKREKLRSRMCGTVHDSIVFDIYLPEFYILVPKVKHIMEHIHEPYIDTKVPILSEIEAGDSYGGVFEMSPEEAEKMRTTSDFHDWLHEKKIDKYTNEIKYLHDKAEYDKKDMLSWMIKNNRPVDELQNVIREIYT